MKEILTSIIKLDLKFPMFWIGEWCEINSLWCLLFATVEYVLWIYVLFGKFRKKMG